MSLLNETSFWPCSMSNSVRIWIQVIDFSWKYLSFECVLWQENKIEKKNNSLKAVCCFRSYLLLISQGHGISTSSHFEAVWSSSSFFKKRWNHFRFDIYLMSKVSWTSPQVFKVYSLSFSVFKTALKMHISC